MNKLFISLFFIALFFHGNAFAGDKIIFPTNTGSYQIESGSGNISGEGDDFILENGVKIQDFETIDILQRNGKFYYSGKYTSNSIVYQELLIPSSVKPGTFKRIREVNGKKMYAPGGLNSVGISPEGKFLVYNVLNNYPYGYNGSCFSGDNSTNTYIFNIETGEEKLFIKSNCGYNTFRSNFSFSPDGNSIIYGTLGFTPVTFRIKNINSQDVAEGTVIISGSNFANHCNEPLQYNKERDSFYYIDSTTIYKVNINTFVKTYVRGISTPLTSQCDFLISENQPKVFYKNGGSIFIQSGILLKSDSGFSYVTKKEFSSDGNYIYFSGYYPGKGVGVFKFDISNNNFNSTKNPFLTKPNRFENKGNTWLLSFILLKEPYIPIKFSLTFKGTKIYDSQEEKRVESLKGNGSDYPSINSQLFASGSSFANPDKKIFPSTISSNDLESQGFASSINKSIFKIRKGADTFFMKITK